MIVSENDHDLVNNVMVYRLASPNRVDDVSWIKPGKVAWDWWNDWNIYNVDFESGINNDTYKYYIDFASDKGVEYVILDEGWSVHGEANLLNVIPEIDLPMLVDYANSKNVGLILWAGYWALNRDIEGICKHYSDVGIKGFKVDFMDRDDQPMVEFHHEVAEVAAQYKLLIDYHGSYKPTGLQRTYPNFINFEGVHGLEQMKWAFFFVVIGMNPLTIYLASNIIRWESANEFTFRGVANLFPEAWAPIIMSIGYIFIGWMFLYFLYKNKIFLKI